MLERSPSGKHARHVFFAAENDIDVFVEDTAPSTKKIYLLLLNRIFAGSLKVNEIFQLGGRREVLARCARDQGARSRRCVYIVDADLDVLDNSPLPPLRRLFRLPVYCIENVLVSRNAFEVSIFEDSSVLTLDEVREQLDFDAWEQSNTGLLIQLFRAFLVARRHGIPYSIPSAEQVMLDRDGRSCAVKVAGVVAQVRSSVDSKVGKGLFDQEMAGMESGSLPSILSAVSAKRVLLPLLYFRARTRLRASVNGLTFCNRLAMRCELDAFLPVVNAIG